MNIGKVAVITLVGLSGWFALIKTSSSQINQPIPKLVSTSIPTNKNRTTPRRFKINVTLTDPSDLKVKQGDKVVKGQILSDRTQSRQQLEAKKRQLEIAIERMSLPLSQIAEPPKSDFSIQEMAIKTAKAELELINQTPLPEFRFKGRELQNILDREVVKERAAISEAKLKASIGLTNAIAQLEKARTNHQQQQYQHSLNLIRQQTNMQRQQYQLASLVAQLQEVEAKLSEIVAVKSPYNGNIRRIKILGQTDRNITAEIRIHVEDS
ncbi:MAG: hypothetical protein AAGG00_02385 [Cyanobacteria bacterium P01_H01_bin.150]